MDPTIAIVTLTSFCFGFVLLTVALLRRPVRRGSAPLPVAVVPDPQAVPIIGPPPVELQPWTRFLGVNEILEAPVRARIAEELGALNEPWAETILLVAAERERDPLVRDAIASAIRGPVSRITP